jgi:hypothetical protein
MPALQARPTAGAEPSPRAPIVRIALASFVGTAIEWYDFLLYGTAAALVFNRLFFPAFDPLVGTLAAFATFAVGFLSRPLGGALFGHFGDRLGRRSMLVASLLVMGFATATIGLLPTYEQVGALAPLLLIALRFLQGIGLGGEWGAAVLLAVEHAPPGRRGFYGSWPQVGGPAGIVAANGAFAAMATLPEADLLTWGWRVPFLLSLVLVVVGLVVRRALPESPTFDQIQRAGAASPTPVLEVLRTHRRPGELLRRAIRRPRPVQRRLPRLPAERRARRRPVAARRDRPARLLRRQSDAGRGRDGRPLPANRRLRLGRHRDPRPRHRASPPEPRHHLEQCPWIMHGRAQPWPNAGGWGPSTPRLEDGASVSSP